MEKSKELLKAYIENEPWFSAVPPKFFEIKSKDMCCIRLINDYNCDYVIVDNLNQWYLCNDGNLDNMNPCTIEERDHFVKVHHESNLVKYKFCPDTHWDTVQAFLKRG